MGKVLIVIAGMLAPLLLMSACRCTASRRQGHHAANPTDEETWRALDRHWIHDENLRELMAKLVRDQDWPDRNVDEDSKQISKREKAFDDAAALATALAKAGEELPKIIADRDVKPADREAFESHAKKLHNLANALRERAEQRDLDGMKRLLDAIERTCTSCHNRFRDFSELLGPRRA